jgi:hypothetical protein
MRPIRLSLAGLFGLVLAASVHAQVPCYAPIPQAPSACYPTTYNLNCCGLVYPLYCPYPPFPPFQGMVPGPPQPCGNGGGGLGSPVFPSHPYARSPRDFYMYYERGRDAERPF